MPWGLYLAMVLGGLFTGIAMALIYRPRTEGVKWGKLRVILSNVISFLLFAFCFHVTIVALNFVIALFTG